MQRRTINTVTIIIAAVCLDEYATCRRTPCLLCYGSMDGWMVVVVVVVMVVNGTNPLVAGSLAGCFPLALACFCS